MGLARDLCTRHFLLELQLLVAQYRSIGVYRLSDETRQIRSRIGGGLSHAFLSLQGKDLHASIRSEFRNPRFS